MQREKARGALACSQCQGNLCFGCWPRFRPGEWKEAYRKEVVDVQGRWAKVAKHSSMGCAIITFKEKHHRDAVILKLSTDPPTLGGIRVDVKAHLEKQPDGSRREAP